jgi:hypothetical protein
MVDSFKLNWAKAFPAHWVESLYHCLGHQINSLLVKQAVLIRCMLSVNVEEALEDPS